MEFVNSIGRGVASHYIGKRMWRTLQETALGLSGCPYPITRVQSGLLHWAGFEFGESLSLDKTVVDYAMELRKRSAHDAAAILSSCARTNRAIEAGLINVMADLFTGNELIHGAYYTHERVIKQIAAWIEMSIEEKFIRYMRDRNVTNIEFAKTATHRELTLAMYSLEMRDADEAMLDELNRQEEVLLENLSQAAREAYHARTSQELHPF